MQHGRHFCCLRSVVDTSTWTARCARLALCEPCNKLHLNVTAPVQLYNRHQPLTAWTFWKTGILLGILHAAIVYFVVFYSTTKNGAKYHHVPPRSASAMTAQQVQPCSHGPGMKVAARDTRVSPPGGPALCWIKFVLLPFERIVCPICNSV